MMKKHVSLSDKYTIHMPRTNKSTVYMCAYVGMVYLMHTYSKEHCDAFSFVNIWTDLFFYGYRWVLLVICK